jgi:ectoine hydroxylase-related dioxygenase (phytanoyl-CoA dioxygenase family)
MLDNGVLTAEQLEQFATRGFILLKGAFSREKSLAWVADECRHKGIDVDDPTTWNEPYVRVPTQHTELLSEFSPLAFELSNALMGGENRVVPGVRISLFAMNFFQGADKPFEAPTSASPGWHKDGWHFRHFLDSPDQGLLGIPLLTDVLPSGGATFIAAGSVGPVARFLADHPEGVLPNDFPWKSMLEEPGIEFLEATGEAGDFYLLHPYLLHAVSQNVLRRARAISNILYVLREQMQFDRADGNYSPVEAAVLHGLGVDRYDFQLKGERLKSADGGPLRV